eukprot:g5513.t1.1.5e174189 g5513  g5513.t1 contig2:680585-681970(-)
MANRPPNPAANAKVEMTTLSSGASYPTFLEPLTKNETALLDMYATIKSYEKEAARIKAEEAKRRLEEADERYQAKVRERERAEGRGGSDDEEEGALDVGRTKASARGDDAMQQPHDNEDDSEHVDSDEDEETKRRRKKRAQEISQLRKDVTEAREARNQKEAERQVEKQKAEAKRRELMGEVQAKQKEAEKESKKRHRESDEEEDHDDIEEDTTTLPAASVLTGPTIKKKRVENSSWDESKPKPSLIANISGDTTPLHDFSKKLKMGKASLDGTVLFPPEANPSPWQPPNRPVDFIDGSLELELSDFDPSKLGDSYSSGNNTLAIKFNAPEESSRFSINIAGPNNDNYNNILFHFNPRHFQKGGQLVINDRKESMWGNDISVPLSTLPLMFGTHACTLVVQMNEDGFDVFVEGVHCCRLEYRTELPRGKGSLFCSVQVLMIMGVSSIMRSCNTEEAVGVIR